MKLDFVGNGKVVLIAGGGKVYTDIAARFVKSEKSIEEIIASPYDANIVKNILDSGHKAATEFDYFVFGIEGYGRPTEIQLVRKRLASFMIKSGRAEKGGKRSYDIVMPKTIMKHKVNYHITLDELLINNTGFIEHVANKVIMSGFDFSIPFDTANILNLLEDYYNSGIESGLKEEELRYMKPQGTEFKAIIGMNVHGLLDWFQIRCCENAQTEIRDLATKMLKLCKTAAPDLFENAGPSCKVLGYCPENRLQNKKCINKIYTKNEAIDILRTYKNNK